MFWFILNKRDFELSNVPSIKMEYFDFVRTWFDWLTCEWEEEIVVIEDVTDFVVSIIVAIVVAVW